MENPLLDVSAVVDQEFLNKCVEQINKANHGVLTLEELKKRQAKAMQDPEVQNIFSDPVMRQVLVAFQENPKAAQEHMKNPMVMNKIQKINQNQTKMYPNSLILLCWSSVKLKFSFKRQW